MVMIHRMEDIERRIRTGVTVSYDPLFQVWQIYAPPVGKGVYGLRHTRDPKEAADIYLRLCKIYENPPTLEEAILTMPPPVGGDDTMESENPQTGLGVTPGWWRPELDRSHYD